MPGVDVIDQLANNPLIGQEIYDFVAVEPRLPSDPRLRYIVKHWSDLSKEEQERHLSLFRQQIESTAPTKLNGMATA